MNLFFVLLWKILPLYSSILIGFLASRYLAVNREGVAALLIYVIGPMVVFSATMSVKINMAILFLPIFFYLFSSILAFTYLKMFKNKWTDSTSNILAFTAGTGNTGYYGIALAIIIFEPATANIFIFTILASFLYEATTGFYITAKGTFTARQSLAKVSRLPALYAFSLALILNLSGVSLPASIAEYASQFKIVFSILGMMLVGMGLNGLWKANGFDLQFLRLSLCAKHVVWPLLICGFMLLDKTFFHFLYEDLYKVMFVFAIVPLAGNTVSLAVLLKAQPEKAALAVLLSNVFSIVYIPTLLSLFEIFWPLV